MSVTATRYNGRTGSSTGSGSSSSVAQIFTPSGGNDDDLVIAQAIYNGARNICLRGGTSGAPFKFGNHLVIGKSFVELFSDDGSYVTEAYGGNYGVKDSISGGIENSLIAPGIGNQGKLGNQTISGINYLVCAADYAPELGVAMQILSSAGTGTPQAPLALNTTYYLTDARKRQTFVDSTGSRTSGLLSLSTTPWGTPIVLTDAGSTLADLVLARNGFSSAGVSTGASTITTNLYDNGELNVGDEIVIGNLTTGGTNPAFTDGTTFPYYILTKVASGSGFTYTFSHGKSDASPAAISGAGSSSKVFTLIKVVEGIRIHGINFDTSGGTGINSAIQFQINTSGFQVSDCSFKTGAATTSLAQVDLRGSSHSITRNTFKYDVITRGLGTSGANIVRGSYIAFNEFLLDGQASGTDINLNNVTVNNVVEGNRLTNNSTANASITVSQPTATTGAITSGTAALVVASATNMLVGYRINIAGVTGTKVILAVSGTTVTIDSNADATVVAGSITFNNNTIGLNF